MKNYFFYMAILFSLFSMKENDALAYIDPTEETTQQSFGAQAEEPQGQPWHRRIRNKMSVWQQKTRERFRRKTPQEKMEEEQRRYQEKMAQLQKVQARTDEKRMAREHKARNCGPRLDQEGQALKEKYLELKAKQKQLFEELLPLLKKMGHPCAKKFWNKKLRYMLYIQGREAAIHFLEKLLEHLEAEITNNSSLGTHHSEELHSITVRN